MISSTLFKDNAPQNAMKFQDKVILLTGASGKLGSPMAFRLARDGAKLALAYGRSGDRATALKKEIGQAGGEAEIFKVDLSQLQSAAPLIEAVTKHFGRLDALINSASVFFPTPLEDISDEAWEKIWITNTGIPTALIRCAAPWLKKSRGAVVNITDMYGRKPDLPDHIPYCMSKGALNTLTKAFALALAPEVRVNAVAPGTISLPDSYCEEKKQALRKKVPLGREGSAEDIAEAVAFLLTSASYVTGQVLAVDGGLTM